MISLKWVCLTRNAKFTVQRVLVAAAFVVGHALGQSGALREPFYRLIEGLMPVRRLAAEWSAWFSLYEK